MSRETTVVPWRTFPYHFPSGPPPPVDEFFFEERTRLSESEFVALRRLPPPPGIHVAALAVAGIACLFWSVTLLLGVALLLGAVALVGTPWVGTWSSKKAWRDEHRHLQVPISFGVSHREAWRKSDGIHVRFAWSRLSGWRMLDGWLQLASDCGGLVYLRMESLDRAGVREAVLECIAHVENTSRAGEAARALR